MDSLIYYLCDDLLTSEAYGESESWIKGYLAERGVAYRHTRQNGTRSAHTCPPTLPSPLDTNESPWPVYE